MEVTFLDIFSGIGGARKGLEDIGFLCNGYVEKDEYARKAYNAIFNTEGEYFSHDIRETSGRDLPRSDIWVFGSPCQDLSVSGSREGFSGRQSVLFFEVIRLLNEIPEEFRPEWFIFENVMGLLSTDRGYAFLNAQVAMGQVGYDTEWDVLSPTQFGIPQLRKRVFIVGHLRKRGSRKVFPLTVHGGKGTGKNEVALKELTKGVSDAFRVYDPSSFARTQKAESGGTGGKTGLYEVDFNRGINGAVKRIRRLTPREVWRSFGRSDEEIDKAFVMGLSDAQLYRMGGNSICPAIVSAIGESIKREIIFHNKG